MNTTDFPAASERPNYIAVSPSPAARGSAKQMSLVDALLFSGVRKVKLEQFETSRPLKVIYDGTESYWEDAPSEGRWHGKAWHSVEPVLGGWRWDWVEVWVPAVSPNMGDQRRLPETR
jgi:hypothetical protein